MSFKYTLVDQNIDIVLYILLVSYHLCLVDQRKGKYFIYIYAKEE
jgi:hypothetical protein